YKSEISETFSVIRSFSFNEKKSSLIDEGAMNTFLDAILGFKSKITTKAKTIVSITERMDKLTWFTDPDEDSLMLLNDLIAAAKDVHSSLTRQYVSLAPLQKKEIAKKEINGFKNSVDGLKEFYEDLESVFFFLPKMPEFVETDIVFKSCSSSQTITAN
ncbi:MAG: hypothetical protein ACPGU0_05400, partial [Marinirhabdus sp.]